MVRSIFVGSIAVAALAGCNAQSKVDDAKAIAAMPAGMVEASDRMTAAAKRQKSGVRPPRHTRGIAAWNKESGLDEGAPIDAPQNGWAAK